ncbi:MAG TPA: hypothetical protein VGO31_14630 [Microbacteriaceae bacterium]|jgi:hypothetical protein|nr:hypothetical protein [Microbacteriaceae bacterium]
MNVQVVRTPTDMRAAITEAYFTHYLAIPEVLEPEVRRAADGIFADFALMSPHDEPGLIASYLQSIEEPIRDLHGLGVQLVYFTSRGSVMGTPVNATVFMIAPSPCYLRVEGDASAPVHMLGARCDAHAVFEPDGEEVGVRLWLSTEAVDASFEHSGAPWCVTCSMASVGRG